MIKAGIIGATGYAGFELLRLLQNHPKIEVSAISSVSFEGQDISEIYPAIKQNCDYILTNENEVIEKSDIIFAALPHGMSEKLATKCIEKDKLFIDLGADFRLSDPDEYEEWYKLKYENLELHNLSTYSIPELHRKNIKNKKIIANPGCYPTSVILGLAPAIKKSLIKPNIIIDSKSGVTGAGRGLSQTTHYPDANEAFSAYKIASHRHTPEIEENISDLFKKKVNVTFVPHLLPVNRGILSTIYCELKIEKSQEEISNIYKKFYEKEYFVRISNVPVNIKNVRYSNYCDISVHIDKRTNRLIICSVIDNMIKGAAGQAIQNANILLGIKENTGLCYIPPAF